MGTVFNIQWFCSNDGPGIRTTVFLKGCPLRCLWCHNPESKSARPQISYAPERCIGCGACASVCPLGLHRLEDGMHLYDRTGCTGCGSCAEVCTGALERMGSEMSAEEVLQAVEKDRLFYGEDGGMTVSGGEPFFQFPFLMELLQKAKEHGIGVCIETCGYTDPEKLMETLPLVDTYLYDIKETDPARHREYTGVSNERILQNLALLDEQGAKIVLRCPIIPGYNDRDEHFQAIGELTKKHGSVIRVDLEPYHPLGAGKSASIGVPYALEGLGFPENEVVESWLRRLKEVCRCEVRKG